MEQKARELLAARGSDIAVTGGLALRSALSQARLDDTLDSLDRAQALLAQIHQRYQPTRAQWSQDPGRENFLLLLAFHLGDLAARHGNAAIRWVSFEEAQRVLPPDQCPQASPATRVLGLMPGAICVPLGVVESHLFDDAPPLTLRAYVQRLVDRAQPAVEPIAPLKYPVPILRVNASRAPGDPLPPAWRAAVAQAGALAFLGMKHKSTQAQVVPVVVRPREGARAEVDKFEGGEPGARRAADDRMARPAAGTPWQVLLADGDGGWTLEGGGALVLDVRCYAPGEPFQARIRCPYVDHKKPEDFVVEAPQLVACSAPLPRHMEIFRLFYQAVEAGGEGFDWGERLDESA